MNIAILSVSDKGKKLSARLKTLLDEDFTIIKTTTFHKNVKDSINIVFNGRHDTVDNATYNNFINKSYDAIIGIMATGILIRNIADKIQDKTRDPAIISMDDNGKYVISLVSGHLGGANELAKKIAKLIGGEPVITTATDTNNKIGIDTLASKLHWEIVNKSEILSFNKVILEEKNIKIYINTATEGKILYKKYIEDYIKNQEKNTLEIIDLKNKKSSIDNILPRDSSNNIADDNSYNDYNIIATFNNHIMFFEEKKIVIGIGAKANISKEKIIEAIQIVLNNLKLPIERVDYISTAEIKKDETGILEAVREINKPLKIVGIDEIKNFKSPDISKSKFVKEKFDIPGVAEPTAMIVAKKESNNESRLIHKKTPVDGVAVAVAVSK